MQLWIQVENLKTLLLHEISITLKLVSFAAVHWQSMMGGLTTISLGALVVFHLAFGLGNLLKVLHALERLLMGFALTFHRSRPITPRQIWSAKEPRERETLLLRSYWRVSLPAGKSLLSEIMGQSEL